MNSETQPIGTIPQFSQAVLVIQAGEEKAYVDVLILNQLPDRTIVHLILEGAQAYVELDQPAIDMGFPPSSNEEK